MTMKNSIVALAFVAACTSAWALASTQDVEAAIQQGQYGRAETMMREVVAAKPDSPRAHYIYAEVLAHNGSFSKASTEAAKARELDPALKFTSPEKFRSFELLLQREQNASLSSTTTPLPAPAVIAPARAVQPQPASTGIPGWIWLVGVAALGFLLFRGLNRSRAAAMPGPYGPGQTTAGGVPMSYGPAGGVAPYGTGMPQQPSAGGGLLGTGLAVAGGVAGGMMLDRLLHHGQDGSANGGNFGGFGNAAGGGNTPLDRVMPGAPGLDEAGRQLEDRSIDFGSGNDWDADGGSVDVGGGSDGGGGWD